MTREQRVNAALATAAAFMGTETPPPPAFLQRQTARYLHYMHFRETFYRISGQNPHRIIRLMELGGRTTLADFRWTCPALRLVWSQEILEKKRGEDLPAVVKPQHDADIARLGPGCFKESKNADCVKLGAFQFQDSKPAEAAFTRALKHGQPGVLEVLAIIKLTQDKRDGVRSIHDRHCRSAAPKLRPPEKQCRWVAYWLGLGPLPSPNRPLTGWARHYFTY